MAQRTPRLRRVIVWPQAVQDVERLTEDDRRLGIQALAIVKRLERGENGGPLDDKPKFGDLSDCRKWYFGVPGKSQTSHRLVYEQKEDGSIDVLEVVAVEARMAGYVYGLAANRLGRLPNETKPLFKEMHQEVVARRGEARRKGRSLKKSGG